MPRIMGDSMRFHTKFTADYYAERLEEMKRLPEYARTLDFRAINEICFCLKILSGALAREEIERREELMTKDPTNTHNT